MWKRGEVCVRNIPCSDEAVKSNKPNVFGSASPPSVYQKQAMPEFFLALGWAEVSKAYLHPIIFTGASFINPYPIIADCM